MIQPKTIPTAIPSKPRRPRRRNSFRCDCTPAGSASRGLSLVSLSLTLQHPALPKQREHSRLPPVLGLVVQPSSGPGPGLLHCAVPCGKSSVIDRCLGRRPAASSHQIAARQLRLAKLSRWAANFEACSSSNYLGRVRAVARPTPPVKSLLEGTSSYVLG